MKPVNTIEQYYIVKYLYEHFFMDAIDIELIDRFTILVSDIYGDILYFRYEDGKINFYDMIAKQLARK